MRDWLPVVAWTLFIYVTIPLARAVQERVTEHWTRAAFSWAVYASVAIGVRLRSFSSGGAPCRLRAANGLLGVLAAIFAWGTWHLRGNAEAIHLPQYGVLSLLLYRAYSRRYGDRGAYACAALLGAFLGIFDEVIQWAVPRRYFQFRDIIINVLSVLLIQAGLAAGLATRCRMVPAGLRSARAAWRLAALVLLLLLGCFSNTPLCGARCIHTGRTSSSSTRRWSNTVTGHDDDYDVFLSRYSPPFETRSCTSCACACSVAIAIGISRARTAATP